MIARFILNIKFAAVLVLLFTSVFGDRVMARTSYETTGYEGIQIIAVPARMGVTYDVSIVPSKQALERIVKALDVIYTGSPYNRDGIEFLKKRRRVVVLYDPDHYQEQLGFIMAATFRPEAPEISQISDGRKQLVVTVTRHGIKWPVQELAAVIVHELIGHGIQHLDGRLEVLRELDRECEAWMRMEQAFQDFSMDKTSQEMIMLRKQMEYYCSDFSKYLLSKNQKNSRLWDVLDPDIPKLLKLYSQYINDMYQSGALVKSAKAAANLTGDALKKLFETGNPQTQFAVANLVYQKSSNSEDRKYALTWMSRAAKQGLVDAQYRLGEIIHLSKSKKAKGETALYWYKKAARQGYLKAQNAIGSMLERGEKVAKAPEQAAKWYQVAASRGHVGSQYRLGIMYEKGLGAARDYKEAAKWYMQAAGSGHPLAQSAIGYLYERGLGVRKDLSKAMHWYKKGANQGYSKPQFNVGVMYAKGRGVKQDDVEAVRWLREAASQNYARAQRVLGIMLQKGQGESSDLSKALFWYQKAAGRGDKKAKKLAEALKKSHPELVQ